MSYLFDFSLFPSLKKTPPYFIDFGLAHASKAIIPRDETGQWARRIGSVVSGAAAKSKTLIVTAYKTPGTNSSGSAGAELNRYSLVRLSFAHTCFRSSAVCNVLAETLRKEDFFHYV